MSRILYPLLVIAILLFTLQLSYESVEPLEWHCEDFEYKHRARLNTATVCISQSDTVVTDSGYGTTNGQFKQQLIDSTDYDTSSK